MRKTLRVLRNILITVHWSAAAALAFVFTFEIPGADTWSAGAWAGLKSAGILVSLYAVVLLHELGHCYESIRRGVMVDKITIWALGGVAHIDLEKPFIEPRDEFWIAVAGPLVNAVFIAASVPLILLFEGTILLPAVAFFVAVNVILLAFNMLPAFPMDGGRMLRSALSMLLDDETRAQTYTSYTAFVFGAAFVLYGTVNMHVALALIGVLVIAVNIGHIRG